jgi:hypothetical protein
MKPLLGSIPVLLAWTAVALADTYPSGPGPCDTVDVCETECTAGKMKSCTWGGFVVLQSPFDVQARARAKVMFEAACTKGDTESCWQAARLEESTSHKGSSEPDPQRATKVATAYERACKKQHVRACVSAGYWVAEGGDAKAKAAGLALYKKAATIASQRCERKKDAPICEWISYFYADGYYLPKDEKKAEKYRQRACKLRTNKPCDPT